MPPTLTETQALSLISDRNSQQRGKKLAADLKPWLNLGADELSVWGECQGSGSEAYQVAAGLLEAASKCSCPRPDTPCKHAAGLLLLYARQPELFTHPAPDRLAAWRSVRQQHVARTARQGQPRDPAEVAAEQATAAARLANGVDTRRQQRMVAGATELAAVLEDVVRQGFARQPLARPDFWATHAKRLTDNQLPGLALALRQLPELAAQPEQLLAGLGELYVLLRACQRLPNLPVDLRQEVLQQAGVTFRRDDLLAAAAPVEDQWQVLGRISHREPDQYGGTAATSRRTWLHGAATGHYAMLYDYAFGYHDLPDELPDARYQVGGLAYYPSQSPLRATPDQLTPGDVVPLAAVPAGVSIGQLLAGYAAAVGRTPWLRQYPMTLTGVVPALSATNHRCLHQPAENLTVPLLSTFESHSVSSHEFDHHWELLLGNSGGQPCSVFGEWDGQHLRLLRSWPGGHPAPADLPARAATAPTGSGRAEPWPTLVQAATVGLAATPLPELPGLPPAATPAQRLLLAAGTAALLQKISFESLAGARPLVRAASAPAETRSLPSPDVVELLHEVLVGKYWGLLPDYLHLLDAHGLRLPAALLVLLLHGHSPLTHGLLGEAGAWLLAQPAPLRDYLNLAPPSATPAAPPENPRLQALRQPNKRERAWNLAQPLLTLKRPAGKPPRLDVSFPKAWGADWRAVGIAAPVYGSREQGGKFGTMLWEVLAWLPLRRWAEHFGLPMATLVDLAAVHPRAYLLRVAWCQAALLYPDAEAAAQLVRWSLGPDVRDDDVYSHAVSLLAQLPPTERLALLSDPALAGCRYLLPLVLHSLPAPWPVAPAAALLPYLRTELLPAMATDVDSPARYVLLCLSQVVGNRPVAPVELLPAYTRALAELAGSFPFAADKLLTMQTGVQLQQRLLTSTASLPG